MTSAAELFLRFAGNDGPIVPYDEADYDDIMAFLAKPESKLCYNNDTGEWEAAPWWYDERNGEPLLLGRPIVRPQSS